MFTKNNWDYCVQLSFNFLIVYLISQKAELLSGCNMRQEILKFCIVLLTIVTLHFTLYIMIKSFADRYTKELYDTGKSKRFPPDIWKRALRRLEYLDLATCLNDLRVPPSNRLHELERDRAGQFSISVNDQWRICFRFLDADAYDIELPDYH